MYLLYVRIIVIRGAHIIYVKPILVRTVTDTWSAIVMTIGSPNPTAQFRY